MQAPHYMRNLRDMGPVRRVGLQLLAEGVTQSGVARELGVSRTTASNWAASLAGVAPAGDGAAASCTPSLSAAQLRELEGWLGRSPRGHGFPGDEWTTARVAVLIECAFGVACSTVQAWRIRNAARDNAGDAGAPQSLRQPAALSQAALDPAPAGHAGGTAARLAGCVRNATWAGGTGYTVACSDGVISRIDEISK